MWRGGVSVTDSGPFQGVDDVEFAFDERQSHQTLAVLQCSMSKKPGELPAQEKYAHKNARLFPASRDYVEALDLEYIILSGLYGALLPEDVIDDYDTAVDDRQPSLWRHDVVDALDDRDVDLDEYDEIRLLATSQYREPLRDVFENTDALVTAPLMDCAGNGYMLGRITDWVDAIGDSRGEG